MKWVDKKIFNFSFPGRGKNSPFFFQKKGPSPAVENRKRFSTAGAGSPPIPKESEETTEIGEKPVFFTEPYMARQKNLSHIWLGKKILAINGSAKKSCLSFRFTCFFPLPLRGRGNKILPFLPISSKSEERPSPQIPLESEGTRNRKNGRPLRFQRNMRGPGVGGNIEKKIEVLLISLKLFLPTHSWVGKNSFHLFFRCPPKIL